MRCSVLFLTTVLPRNPRTGGEIVSRVFLNTLIESGANVDVIGYDRENVTDIIHGATILSAGVRTIESGANYWHSAVWFFKSLIYNEAFSVQKYSGRTYRRILAEVLEAHKYDYIIVDHLQTYWSIKDRTLNNIIFLAHNVEHNLYSDLAKNSRSIFKKLLYYIEAIKIYRAEKFILQKAHQAWMLTNEDKKSFDSIITKRGCKTLSFECPTLMAYQEPIVNQFDCDICLIGTWTWDANMKALEYFVQSVLPLLPKNLKIFVAGKGADNLLSKYSDIKYFGFVESAEDFMRKAKLVALPAVAGAGVQIKTIDAICVGRPIVANTFALRGLNELPNFVHAAQDAEEFAKKIVHILNKNKFNFNDEAENWACQREQNFKTAVTHALKII